MEISSIEEKHLSRILIIQLFNVVNAKGELAFTKPIDIIRITQNDISSSQGKLQKANGPFSFGSSLIGDYNIIGDPNIACNQFDISYDELVMKYYINDVNQGTGVFLKIKVRCIIENGFVFNYSNNNSMKFIIEKGKPNQIIIQFLEGEFKENIVSFSSCRYKKIRLGRAKTNEIICECNTISRIQWTIIYESGTWVIYNGSFEEEHHHPSTNGLWRLITEKTEITNDSLWKTGEKMFEAKIIN